MLGRLLEITWNLDRIREQDRGGDGRHSWPTPQPCLGRLSVSVHYNYNLPFTTPSTSASASYYVRNELLHVFGTFSLSVAGTPSEQR